MEKFRGFYQLARESLDKGTRADQEFVAEDAAYYYGKVKEIVQEAMQLELPNK